MIREMGSRRQFQDHFLELYPELRGTPNEKGEGHLATKSITFVVTENCNLRCSYCYECHKDYEAVMSKETARKAVDMILTDSMMEGYINSEETPGVIIEFIGGEPLLQIELIDYICDYFRYKAFELNHPWYKYHMLNMTSNGVLYNDPRVQQFIKKNSGRLSITITIDGDKSLHDSCRVFPDGSGSYDVVEKAIKKAQIQFGLKTSKITLAPENIQYTFQAVKYLFEMGLTDLNANVVYEDVWDADRDAPILYDQLIQLADWMIESKMYEKGYCSIFDSTIGQPMLGTDNQNWCGGNGQMLAIGTDGRLFPCIRFMRYSLSNPELPEWEIGNVDRGIDKEEDNEYLKCLSCITRKSQSTDECFNCKVARGCAWCTGYNYDAFGTPDKRAIFDCWLHKARVLANYYYWNKVYKADGDERRFQLNLSDEEIERITKGDSRWKNV